MNPMGVELAVDNQIVSLLSSVRFADGLLNCAQRTGEFRYFDESRCAWASLCGSERRLRAEVSGSFSRHTEGYGAGLKATLAFQLESAPTG